MTTLNDAREGLLALMESQKVGGLLTSDIIDWYSAYAAQVAEALKGEAVYQWRVAQVGGLDAWADCSKEFFDSNSQTSKGYRILYTAAPAVVSAAGLSDETRLFADGFDYGFVCGQENPVGHRKDAYVIQAWKEYKVQP
jgi:hypothetical protein